MGILSGYNQLRMTLPFRVKLLMAIAAIPIFRFTCGSLHSCRLLLACHQVVSKGDWQRTSDVAIFSQWRCHSGQMEISWSIGMALLKIN